MVVLPYRRFFSAVMAVLVTASTSFLLQAEDVDARNKSGHDDIN